MRTEGDTVSGYMIVMGPCAGCGLVFGYNPVHVPSYQGNGICESCMTKVNANREALDLPLWVVHADAYEPEEVI